MATIEKSWAVISDMSALHRCCEERFNDRGRISRWYLGTSIGFSLMFLDGFSNGSEIFSFILAQFMSVVMKTIG